MRKKLMAILMSVAMVAALTVSPAFAADTTEGVLADALLIGSTPYAGAEAVAPGPESKPQPIRLAFSEGAETIASDIDSYVTLETNSGDEVAIGSVKTEGNIVIITPATQLAAKTKYKVDFNQDYLPNVADFTFTTSKGGTGSGTGGGSGTGSGSGQGSQNLVLTGKIPTDSATVDASQVMYLTFSTNIKKETSNVNCFAVVDANNQPVDATVSIIDNWTAEITVSNLATGQYTLAVDGELIANSGNKLGDDVEIVFYV